MASIGDLFLRLVADDKGFAVDVEKKAAAAGDKAGKSFGQRMSGGFKKFGASIQAGLGLGAGLAGFQLLDRGIQAVIGGLGDAVQAAREEEQSIAGLDAALRANVPAWNGNRDAIEKVLASRIKLGFADDEQRTSLGRLIAITKDETEALRIQGIAMDLARLRGIDLAAASEIVGKVYGGNIGILSRYGIQVRKGATATEALAQVQAMASGQAEAWAETTDGELITSQIRVGEVMERLGGIILPALADAMGFVADLFENTGREVETVARIVGEAGTFIHDSIAKLLEPLAALNDFIGTIPGPWKSSTEEAIRLTAVYAAETYKNSKLAADGSYQAVEDARAGFRTATDAFAAELPNSIERVGAKVITKTLEVLANIASALRDNRAGWQSSLALLSSDLENEMSRGAEIAAIQAALTGDELARGLKSKDPVVKAQAAATKKAMTDRLQLLEGDARRIGSGGGQKLKEGLDSKSGAVSGAARGLRSDVKGPLTGMPAYTWGRNIGGDFASGLTSKQAAVEHAAARLAGAVGNFLKVSSPAEKGPLSEGGGPGGWGERGADLYTEGWEQRLPRLASILGNALAMPTLTPQMAFAAPSPMSQLSAPAVSSVGSRAGVAEISRSETNVAGDHVEVNVAGLLPVRTARDIVGEMRRIRELRTLPARRRPPLYPVETTR